LARVSNLTYQIKIIVYTNTGSVVTFGDGVLDFGDGSTPIKTPTIDNAVLQPQVGTVIYSINHTFPAQGNYKITFLERSLISDVVNLTNSVNTQFYLESNIFLEPGTEYASPEFLTIPIFWQPIEKEYSLSNGAIDKNDNRLVYNLTSPIDPSSKGFIFLESINVNYYSGHVTWDTKYDDLRGYQAGNFLFGVKVTQYDKKGKAVGTTLRTFQVILEDLSSEIKLTNPIVDTNGKIFVENDKVKTLKVLLETNSSNDNWTIFYDSTVLRKNISFSQYDSSSGAKKFKVGVIKLNSSTDIIRDNPYFITLRAKSTSLNSPILYKDVSYLFFTKDIVLPIITGVNHEEAYGFEIYPNPFSSYFKLMLGSQTIYDSKKIRIFDSSGQFVVESELNSDDQFDTSNLSAGFYILQVDNRRVRAIKK
jgi:hypothetical protein